MLHIRAGLVNPVSSAEPEPKINALRLDRIDEAVIERYIQTFAYVQIRKGKNKNARREVSLTPRIVAMLSQREVDVVNDWCSQI
jgi:hypothetical protein